MAILKHIASKNANYGSAIDYLKYQHDEFHLVPVLDESGNMLLRKEFYLDGLNCHPETFDLECELLNQQYHKNSTYDEIKSHHYIISHDPRDNADHNLTGERAQAIGLEYAKANFPGHQALVCTHTDGNNGTGNIHTHIIINSLRKFDIEPQTYTERPIDCKAGYKHHLTKDYLKHLQKSLMDTTDAIQSKMAKARSDAKFTEAKLKKVNEQIRYLGQYLSTKSVYGDFLKSGNKKSFRQAHAEDIAKYEEALRILKQHSPDGRFPTMKDLRAEKEQLTIQKDAQYDTYHYFKDYHRELQTVCANVDNILGTEREARREQQQSRKNEHSL